MLWALLATAIVAAIAGTSGGGGDVLAAVEKFWRKEIKKSLAKDPQRRAEAFAVISVYRGHVETLQDEILAQAVDFRAVHSNHASTRAEYDPFIERSTASARTALEGFSQAVIDLQAAMGPEAYASARAKVQREMADYRARKIKTEKKQQKKDAKART